MKIASMIAIGGMVALASSANAAQVNVTGYANLATTGSSSVLAPGNNGINNTASTPFSVYAPNFSMSGTVLARSTVRTNADGQREQAMSLSWQNLSVSARTAAEIAFTVTLTQTFSILPEFQNQMASFNSFVSDTDVTFGSSGQRAIWNRTSSDGGKVSDVSIAKTRTSTRGGTFTFDHDAGSGVAQANVGALYTMTMTLNFLLRPDCNLLTLNDCGNGPTDCTLIVVPLPASAYAGLSGLGLVGGLAIKRRRSLKA